MAIPPGRQSETQARIAQKKELKVTSREQVVRDLLSKSWSGNAQIIASPFDIDAVGHRVVHGGPHFEDPRHNVWSYLGRTPGESAEVAPALMRLAWSSGAALAIAPLQDLLDLGPGNRMNVPGQGGGNWRWRVTEDAMSPRAFEWLRDLTQDSTRAAGVPFRFQVALAVCGIK